jgi:chromate transport protein ChrA
MSVLELSQWEQIFFGVFIITLTLIVVFSFKLTHRDHRNLSLTMIFLLGLLVGLLLSPAVLRWLIFLCFIIVLFNIVFGTLINKFFEIEENNIFIDKIPMVWEKFKSPPELKSREGEI